MVASSSGKCPFMNAGTNDKLSRFEDEILDNVYDIEDLASAGKQHSACPYYAARNAAPQAHVSTKTNS